MIRTSVLVGWLLLAGCSEPRTTIVAAQGQLEVASAVVDFGEVTLGERKTAEVDLRNAGGDEVRVCLPRLLEEGCQSASRLDPADQRFDWPLRDMRWALRPAETMEFSVAFAPDRAGPFRSDLVLAHDGENGPELTISLSGTGVTPNLTFSEIAFDFGAISLGARAVRTLVIQNLTSPESTVTLSFADTVVTSTAFELPSLEVKVPPGGEARIELAFSPREERAFQEQLVIDYCPDGCTQAIGLAGTGVAPKLESRPLELTFAAHSDREPSSASLELSSTGSGPLTVLGFEVRDGPAEEFEVVAGALPLVLQPGTSATVQVSHRGRVPGIDVASLVVLSDAWQQAALTVPLLAESTGPNIEVVPVALDFGAVRPGARAERAVVVQNAGNRPLTITGIQVSPAGDVTVAPPALPRVLAPGERTVVPVTFAPLLEGQYGATLSIASDDADQGSLLVPVAGEGGDPTECSITAAPPAIDLGQRERGITALHRVELRNVGPRACTLTNPVIGGDASFSLAPAIPSSIAIEPGASAAIPFEFIAPAYGQFAAVLAVTTDDPTQPTATIPLAARSAASAVRIAPRMIEFGPVNPGCRSGERTVAIHAYNQSATLEAVSLDPSSSVEFELGALALPANVGNNGSRSVPLFYRPSGEGDDFGILHVRVGGVVTSLPLHGRGIGDAAVEEHLQQQLSPKSDVLFVVNDTNSTSGERQRLAQAMPSFFTYGSAQGIDFRVAVTSMEATSGERGRFLAEPPQLTKVITPQSIDPAGAFESNLDADGGGNTSGIQASFLALSDPLLDADNADFLRPDGLLTVVYVTDEDDQSQGDLASYERHLASLKEARGGRFQALAIAGTDPDDCGSTFGDADYSPEYLALVERSGGIATSLCQDFGATVTALGPYAFGRTRRFSIEGAPISTSIEVRVDGTVVPRTDAQGDLQWTYSDQSGAVLFSEAAAPNFGAQVRITYALECL